MKRKKHYMYLIHNFRWVGLPNIETKKTIKIVVDIVLSKNSPKVWTLIGTYTVPVGYYFYPKPLDTLFFPYNSNKQPITNCELIFKYEKRTYGGVVPFFSCIIEDSTKQHHILTDKGKIMRNGDKLQLFFKADDTLYPEHTYFQTLLEIHKPYINFSRAKEQLETIKKVEGIE